MGKVTWAQKIDKWRREKKEEYAKVILSTPVSKTLYQCLLLPGVYLVMGNRQWGKSAMAHKGAEEFHNRRGSPAVLHLPTVPEHICKKVQKLLPDWMQVVTRRSQWPNNCIVIYDEAAQSAHARRSQSGSAVELDDLIGISGQRNQLIFFIAHHSRKLDLNVVHEVNGIIWKRPTYAHQLWERDELSDFTMRAFDFFKGIRGQKAQLKAALFLDMNNFAFCQFTNTLPSYWSEELSHLFRNIRNTSKGVIQ